MNNTVCVKNKIKEIIGKSSVPEDPIHSENTLNWVLKLKSDAGEALKIAALGHDIERAVDERKIKRNDYENYDKFKQAHAENSAKIITQIMNECEMSKELINDVFYLVQNHETGGDKRTDVLRNADIISFFDVNLPFYFTRNSIEETKRRCMWGYRKLSDNLKKIMTNFNYEDKEIDSLVKSCIVVSSFITVPIDKDNVL